MAQWTELNIDQGADFSTFLILTDDNTGLPLNIVSALITSNAKVSYITPNVAFSFSTAITDGANGNVTISLTAADSSNVDPGRYVFDVKSVSSGVTSRVIQGIAEINAQVT